MLLSQSINLLLVVLSVFAAYHVHASEAPPASYWMAEIKRQGTVAYRNSSSNYTIFRNVKDFGAKGRHCTENPSYATSICC